LIAPDKKDKVIQDKLKANGEIPRHIAIIMDGNGRWAKQMGETRIFGHRQGVASVRETVEACGQIGVKYLTLYTFSTENWKRPKDEVTVLMKLLIRLIATGNLEKLPDRVHQELLDAMEKTKNNKLMTLNLALSYSGRWDIINAIHKINDDINNNVISIEDINETNFSDYLVTKDIPDPDLMIRTGGEYRISNFLLWQLAYSEIYIDTVFWPQFRREHLYKAIEEYQKRERRFGLVSEQLKKK
jgi:undecaprenyl diphosphate synthase